MSEVRAKESERSESPLSTESVSVLLGAPLKTTYSIAADFSCLKEEGWALIYSLTSASVTFTVESGIEI